MQDKNTEVSGLWDFVFKATQIAVPVFIAVASVIIVPWCRSIEAKLNTIQVDAFGLDTRVTRLEGFANQGDRFTASMGTALKLELQNEWLKEISEIRRQIDVLPQTLQMPPVWWEQYVRSEIKRIDQRFEAHQTQPNQ